MTLATAACLVYAASRNYRARRTPARDPPENGRLAQVVEQLTLNQRVVGSSPTSPTILHSASHEQVEDLREERCANEKFSTRKKLVVSQFEARR
jgi:hypothetical protein